MKVKKDDAVKLFLAASFKNAKTWSTEKLEENLVTLAEKASGSDAILKKVKEADKASANLLKALMAAVADDKEVTIDDGVKVAAGKTNSKPVKGKKAAAVEEDEDEDTDDDEEDESDEEEEEEVEDSDEDESDEEEDEEDEEDEEEEEEKPKKGKKTKEEKPKKEKKPAKEKVERDKYGVRVNSRAARLNAAVTNKFKTLKEIMEDANYDKPIHGHMNWMLNKEIVEVGEKDGKKAYRLKGSGKEEKPAKKKVKVKSS